jgi:hypothetical protein
MSAMTRQRFVLLPLLLKNPAKSIPSFSCLLQTVLPISFIINTVYALSKRFLGSGIYIVSVHPETLGNFQKSEVGAFPEQIVILNHCHSNQVKTVSFGCFCQNCLLP